MSKESIQKNRKKRYTELKQSLERPGIRDLMIIYDNWRKGHKAEQIHL